MAGVVGSLATEDALLQEDYDRVPKGGGGKRRRGPPKKRDKSRKRKKKRGESRIRAAMRHG